MSSGFKVSRPGTEGFTQTEHDALVPGHHTQSHGDTDHTNKLSDHTAAADPHTAYALDTDLTTHAGAADPHTGYQKESEKSAANGYASLDATTKVPIAEVPTGTTSTTVSLGNHTHAGGSVALYQAEVDFGVTPVSEASFTITNAAVTASSIISGTVAYAAPTGKDLDELDMDGLDLKFAPGTGQLTLYARGLDGYVADKFKINYVVG